MDSNEDLIDKIVFLRNCLMARATGGKANEQEYLLTRKHLSMYEDVFSALPSFVRQCTTLDEFWGFIKSKFSTYDERRIYIFNSFEQILNSLYGSRTSPSDDPVSSTLSQFGRESILSLWSKALDRRSSDPEGAITIARTLLESICKHILDSIGVNYESDIKLPKLFKIVCQHLNLSPEQHAEDIFKQILGGCRSVVIGLGSLRSKLGDSHGSGTKYYRPAPRHAELAVNLSGAMASFLIATYEEIK